MLPTSLLEVWEVANHLRYSHEQVRRLIRAGHLTAVRLGTRSWPVRRRDLEAYIGARLTNG